MTPDDWDSIVEWVCDNFPNSWLPGEAVDVFYKLESFDPSDIWAALYAMRETGQTLAPDSASLILATRREAKAETVPPSESWTAYSMRRFGKTLTPGEVVEQIHAGQPQCANETCKLHNTRIV